MKSLFSLLDETIRVGSIVYLSQYNLLETRSVYEVEKIRGNKVIACCLGGYKKGKRIEDQHGPHDELELNELKCYPFTLDVIPE